MPKLSCVIPVFNEEDNIRELYRRLSEAVKRDFGGFEAEFLFIDDGSSDGSVKEIRNLRAQDSRIKLIEFSRNFGHHVAISAGLDHASGDYVVMMDSDLQDQPEEMIKLYRKLQEGYDVVYGERLDKKFSLVKRLNSAVFNVMLRHLIDERIVINSTIFRMMTRPVVDSIKRLQERNRYVVGVVGWVGFKHAAQPVEHGERFAGKTKYNLSRQVALAMNAALAYSTYVLKLITRVGFLFVGIALLMGIYIIYRRIAFGVSVIGWTSLALTVLAVGGVQIIILGVIGEYVGRLYIEGKNRPLYVIRNFYD